MSESTKNNIIYFTFFYVLLAPQNNINMILQASFIIIVYALSNRKLQKSNFYAGLLVLSIIVSFIITSSKFDIPVKSVNRMIVLSTMLILFPFVKNVKFPVRLIAIALGIILISQLVYVFNIEPLKILIDEFYVSDEDSRYTIEKIRAVTDFSTDFSNFRYGGLFQNPNQCARYTTLLFAVFLIDNNSKSRNFFYLILFFFFKQKTAYEITV